MQTIMVHPIDELEPAAQSRAIDAVREQQAMQPWVWQEEWWQSAQAFCRIAPIEIRSADYDNAFVGVRWDGDDDVGELTGLRAWKWLENNGWFDWGRRNSQGDCLLTGYCGDCPLTDPITRFEAQPDNTTLRELFYDCAHAWICEARNDLEHSFSDEALYEWAQANELAFMPDGAPAPSV